MHVIWGAALKYTWKGAWRKGEIWIEAETLKELEEAMRELGPVAEIAVPSVIDETLPEIPRMLGCTDAVRALMVTKWGNTPRSMFEIQNALESNGLYFKKEALSATLTTLTKSNKSGVQRIKKGGVWKYFGK